MYKFASFRYLVMIMTIVAEEKTTMTMANPARMAKVRDCRVH